MKRRSSFIIHRVSNKCHVVSYAWLAPGLLRFSDTGYRFLSSAPHTDGNSLHSRKSGSVQRYRSASFPCSGVMSTTYSTEGYPYYGKCQKSYAGDKEDVDFDEIEDVHEDPAPPISLDRGYHGVFDVAELVTLLRSERGQDIAVIALPSDARYAEHLVLVSCLSLRHMKSMEQYVRRIYKCKMIVGDSFIHPEGIKSSDWFVLDMGNIVLHIMLPEVRRRYDIETLWCVGSDLDDETQKKTKMDSLQDLLAQYSIPVDTDDKLRAKKRKK